MDKLTKNHSAYIQDAIFNIEMAITFLSGSMETENKDNDQALLVLGQQITDLEQILENIKNYFTT